MKHTHRCLLLYTGIALGGGAAGYVIWACTSAFLPLANVTTSSELLPSDPRYGEVICGPASLALALQRLGLNCSAAHVASRCKVTPQGVDLIELERFARTNEQIEARTQKMSWDVLRGVNGVAVLFVRGDHYVAADPRESPNNGINCDTLRIYEPEKPAQWWTREKTEQLWAGEALVIRLRPDEPGTPRGGPCIAWDECFLDRGVVRNTSIVHYRFKCRNVGDADLVVAKVDKSCGCVEAILSRGRIAPGQSAILKVDVNLRGQEGYVHQNVVVRTNDARMPVSLLKMAAAVPRSRVLSCRALRLEELPAGGTVSQQFYVADPGFNGVKIRDARFVAQNGSAVAGHVCCSFSYALIGKDRPAGLRVGPDDYRVRLTFGAKKDCPLGAFRGDVELVLEADGVCTSHSVQVDGTVVQDVHPAPRVALIAVDGNGVGSAKIQLRSYLQQDISVVKVWSEGAAELEIRGEGGSQGKNRTYIIIARCPDLPAGAPPCKQVACFMLDSGSVVSVPVTIFRPSQ